MRATPNNMKRCETQGIRPVARCAVCGAQYSATSGDYWNRPDGKPLYCHGKAMRLVIQYTEYQEVTPDWFPTEARI